jgi:hypothetical protein
MSVQGEIEAYIAGQPAAKQGELRDLHRLILGVSPDCRLWFLDGRDETGKVVTNPNIGYGATTLDYANGDSRDFYQIGMSANTAGLSVYVMGLDDKAFLARTYGARLGKAKVTGYCLKFRSVKDIDLGVLREIVADQVGRGGAGGL